MPDEKPVNRRSFFRQGLRELLKPLAQALEPLQRAATELQKLDNLGQPVSTPTRWLRPPGALDEQAFKETCSRCGVCTRVCPANCIKIDPTGARGDGAPFIDANFMACVVCDSLACMNSCPSGALKLVPLVQIDMGTAEWFEDRCTRSAGDDCEICVEKCPIGEAAIRTNGRKIEVIEQGCIGCGLCQQHCPTDPKSIVVRPR